MTSCTRYGRMPSRDEKRHHVELTLTSDKLGDMILLMQKKTGKTQGEVNNELKTAMQEFVDSDGKYSDYELWLDLIHEKYIPRFKELLGGGAKKDG